MLFLSETPLGVARSPQDEAVSCSFAVTAIECLVSVSLLMRRAKQRSPILKVQLDVF